MLIIPPLSLYVHLPWCLHKCPYCDFNSHQLNQKLPEKPYINALLKDLDHDLLLVPNRELISIFIGGGTPSLFSPTAINYLLEGIRQRIKWSENIEITLEANPGTTDYNRFKGYYEGYINRLSLGVQSFQTNKLKVLQRIHSGSEAIQAISTAKQAGFNNFNLDLMFGLPDQTIAEGLADLQQAVDLGPTHLSWYQLTLEPQTHFYRVAPQLPNEQVINQLYDSGVTLLKKNAFHQYEISAYCQTAHFCQHNLNYWQFGDYLGIGAGAHSKITGHSQINRLIKHRHPKTYLTAAQSDPINFIVSSQIVENSSLPFEFMLNLLRLEQPVSVSLFVERTGLSIDTIVPALTKGKTLGLLDWDINFIRTTELGKRFYNDTVSLFL